jgi:tellurite resistance protein TerB
VFPPEELQQKFDWYCSKLAGDFEFGKVEAIATIGKLRSKPEQARAVIQIGIIIGGADGNFDAHEKQAVREACNAVGISPAEFDL